MKNTHDLFENIGAVVEHIRHKLRFSRSRMAALLGISDVTYTKFYYGQPVSGEILTRVMERLNLRINVIEGALDHEQCRRDTADSPDIYSDHDYKPQIKHGFTGWD